MGGLQGFRGLGFRVRVSGFRVWVSEFLGFVVRVQGFGGYKALGFKGFWVYLRVVTWSLSMGPSKGAPYIPLVYPVQIKGPYIRTL